MKKSKTKSPFTKTKKPNLKAKITNILPAVILVIALTLVFWRVLSSEQPKKEGPVEISGILLQSPKVYDRWQYFDIDRYKIRADSQQSLSYGDKLEIKGLLEEGRLNDPEIKIVGASKWQKNLFHLRQKLKEKISTSLPEPQASLLAGIVLGAKEELPPDFEEALRKTGTIHVVVVSGYNISVVAGFLIGLSRFIRRQYAIFLGILGIAFYTLLVGAEAPAVRAAIMGSIAFSATLLGRQRFTLYSLFLAAFVMILINPAVVEDIGFQLSFLATAGIVLFQEKIFGFVKFLPKPFSDDLGTTLAAQILVAPVIFYHFGSVSAISPVANAIILWIIPLATVLGFLFLVISFVIPIVATLISWVIWVFLTMFVFMVEIFGKLSFSYLTFKPGNFVPIIVYYVALLLIIYYFKYVRLAKTE